MYRLDKSGHRLPISRDSATREVCNPASQAESLEDWRPADRVTAQLWRCVEALRDTNELLEFVSSATGTKRRRRIRLLAVPLLSLVTEAKRLCHDYLTSPEWKDSLNRSQRDRVSEMLKVLETISADKQSKLKMLRDKYSAHIDKDLMPDRAREIVDKVGYEEIAKWLDTCVEAILGLLDLKQYLWHTNDTPPGTYRSMSLDPWLFTWKINEESSPELVGACVSQAPRNLIIELCQEVLGRSQRVLHECDS